MATLEGGHPEIPEGKTVYRVTTEHKDTKAVQVHTAVVDTRNGPDEAVAAVIAKQFYGIQDETLRAESFWDEFKIRSITPECVQAF